MSPEFVENYYEPSLRLDYDLRAPGFFSYVRWAVKAKVANFESMGVSKLLDSAARDSLSGSVRSAAVSFEKSVSAAEGVPDKKKQSDMLSSAVSEFNSAMKSLDARLAKELRLQMDGKPSVKFPKTSDDEVVLRSADATRFLEENM